MSSTGFEAWSPLKRPSTGSSVQSLRPNFISVTRPDEDLLSSVRTDVIFGEGESVESIYELIQSGEEVDQRSERGFTALALAAAADSRPLVSLLLEKHADVTLASVDRAELPLHYATSLGHTVVCQLLLPPSCVAGLLHAANSAGWTSLHLAVAAGHHTIVRTLLRANAQPNTRNESVGHHTALHLAAMAGHTNVLETLLDFDGDACATDSMQQMPLHLSAAKGDAACVALLLRNRADPLCPGGPRNLVALDLVPPGEHSERICKLLSAYSRAAPIPLRTDARFDLPGGNDILSAYKHPVPWGRRSTPMALPEGPTKVTVLTEEEEDDVWL